MGRLNESEAEREQRREVKNNCMLWVTIKEKN
jgi:hypothetical protein